MDDAFVVCYSDCIVIQNASTTTRYSLYTNSMRIGLPDVAPTLLPLMTVYSGDDRRPLITSRVPRSIPLFSVFWRCCVMRNR